MKTIPVYVYINPIKLLNEFVCKWDVSLFLIIVCISNKKVIKHITSVPSPGTII